MICKNHRGFIGTAVEKQGMHDADWSVVEVFSLQNMLLESYLVEGSALEACLFYQCCKTAAV